MDQFGTFALLGAAFIGLYFIMIRPQQKRVKEQQAQLAKIAEGSRVMLTSGVLCTVRQLGTQQAVVEVSPGEDLTILRQAMVRVVPADEEEFEYADLEPGEVVSEPDGNPEPVAEAAVEPSEPSLEAESTSEAEPEKTSEPEKESGASYAGPTYSSPSYDSPSYTPQTSTDAKGASGPHQQ